MQRNLPGWNFNTFFVLKEGLALGFENIGLLEDALTVYRELAVGLRAVIDEQDDSEGGNQQTTRFSPYTDELKAVFEQALKFHQRAEHGLNLPTPISFHNTSEELAQALDLGTSILDTDRKPFRNLILESIISVFDFKCYVYARQMILLLRLANVLVQKQASIKDSAPNGNDPASTASMQLPTPTDVESVNLLTLAESLELSTEFVASVTRTVREDLKNATKQSDSSLDTDQEVINTIHENLTASWTFSASRCLLEVTATSSLSKQLDPLLRQLKPSSEPVNDKNGGRATDVVHRNDHPTRTSSLPSQVIKSKASAQEAFPSITSLDAMRLLPPAATHPGTTELAAQRGNLLALAKRVLGSLGLRHRGWQGSLADLASTPAAQRDDMQDVNLDEDSAQGKTSADASAPPSRALTTVGVSNKELLVALQSTREFYAAYEVIYGIPTPRLTNIDVFPRI